jgi:hypothetical protein
MIEIPDDVASELTVRKVSQETRAYEVAFETAHADQFNKAEHLMTLRSCTKGKNATAVGLDHRADGGC